MRKLRSSRRKIDPELTGLQNAMVGEFGVSAASTAIVVSNGIDSARRLTYYSPATLSTVSPCRMRKRRIGHLSRPPITTKHIVRGDMKMLCSSWEKE